MQQRGHKCCNKQTNAKYWVAAKTRARQADRHVGWPTDRPPYRETNRLADYVATLDNWLPEQQANRHVDTEAYTHTHTHCHISQARRAKQADQSSNTPSPLLPPTAVEIFVAYMTIIATMLMSMCVCDTMSQTAMANGSGNICYSVCIPLRPLRHFGVKPNCK